MWTLEQARELVQQLYPTVKLAGFELGITGSVLVQGQSAHDLDLIVYPTSSTRQDWAVLEAALTTHGLRKRFDRAFVQGIWRKKGSLDEKHVEVWVDDQKRRVDIFRLT